MIVFNDQSAGVHGQFGSTVEALEHGVSDHLAIIGAVVYD